MRYKKDASKFYFETIGYGNITPTGEYAVGKNMCLVIAMSTAKENNLPYNLRVNKKRVSNAEFYNFDHYLSKGVTIYISDLHKNVIASAIDGIRPTSHYYFINLYEKACDALGISDENRAMTRKRFYKLVTEVKKISKSKYKRLVEKDGFVYIESEIQLP